MSDIRDQNDIIWWDREELVAEVERLHAELERANALHLNEMGPWRELEAEVDRLLALLQVAYDSMTAAGVRGGLDDIRAALEGKP